MVTLSTCVSRGTLAPRFERSDENSPYTKADVITLSSTSVPLVKRFSGDDQKQFMPSSRVLIARFSRDVSQWPVVLFTDTEAVVQLYASLYKLNVL